MRTTDIYFDQLQARIKNHPGKSIFDALKAYDMSKFIFDGNTAQLRQLICVIEDPKDPAQVMGIDHRQHRQWLFHDANRHIHNFLTSITTLVDHSRNLMKEDFIKAAHLLEYQNMVKTTFATDPLAQFLQDFRNYITHYGVPRLGFEKRFGSQVADAEPGQFYIDLDHLQSGFHWSAPGRKFLDANAPKVRMLTLVDDYGLKSMKFYEQLLLTFQKYLGNELNEIHSLMQESNDLWTKIMNEMTQPNPAKQKESAGE